MVQTVTFDATQTLPQVMPKGTELSEHLSLELSSFSHHFPMVKARIDLGRLYEKQT